MKLTRIFALIAVILLAAMYASTIFFALSDSPDAIYLFRASIFCTVIIPVMIYGYMIIYRIFSKKNQPDEQSENEISSDD